MDLDLDLISKEIKKAKQEKGQIAEQMGVDIPHDNFLHGIKQAIETGVPNKSTAKLQVVNERSQNMDVDVVTKQVRNNNITPVNENVLKNLQTIPQNTGHIQQNRQQIVPDRDKQFDQNLIESQQIAGSNNMTMADAMSKYVQPNQGQPQPNNQGMITNPNYLVEQVNNAVQTFMGSSNINLIIEQAVKNTMMEIYEKEKVKDALNENKDIIQKIVVDTILALKKRNTGKK